MNVHDWALKAEIGDSLEYAFIHEGDGPYRDKHARMLHSAMNASDAGLVFLAQKRVPRGFVYVATRISRPTAKLLRLVEA